MVTRAEKKAETRERLLQAAERIATREGFNRLSLERVAQAAGLTKGAIYSNFESKEDLLLQVADRLTVGVSSDDDLVTSSGFHDMLTRVPERLIEMSSKRRKEATIAIEFLAFAIRDRNLQKAIKAMDAEAREVRGLEQWLAEHGTEFPIDVNQFIRMLDAVAIGVIFRRLLYGTDDMPDDLIRWVFARLGPSSD